VIGLSGGLDSAVVLKFLVGSLGSAKVKPFFLPCGTISENDREHAFEAAKSCEMDLEEIDISPIVSSVSLPTEGMARGNLMARARMIFLYTYSNINNGLVVGTSNKSELLMGYFTKYGDGAADIYPIGDLFKTQVRSLAYEIGIPENIISRPPSAGLVRGQTDEGEMGIPYPILDQVLSGHLLGLSDQRIADFVDNSIANEEELKRSGFEPPVNEDTVSRVRQTVRRTRHKRSSLAVPKLQNYTVGVDLRERW
jgi:NAD+ synthase